jgi:hypothetical protein
MSEFLEVCTKSTGCDIATGGTHNVCKSNNPESYYKLNNFINRLFKYSRV